MSAQLHVYTEIAEALHHAAAARGRGGVMRLMLPWDALCCQFPAPQGCRRTESLHNATTPHESAYQDECHTCLGQHAQTATKKIILLVTGMP